jgi:hypothetical protein
VLNKFFHIVFFPLLHLVLLANVLKYEPSAFNLSWVIIFGLLSTLGFVFLYPRNANQPIVFHEVLLVSAGAMVTYFLSVDLAFGPVIAAGFVGFVSSYLPSLNHNKQSLRRYPFALYCGAFVGMSSSFVFDSYFMVLFSGFMTGLIYMFANNSLSGIGGKHGSIAFSGVLITDIIYHAF